MTQLLNGKWAPVMVAGALIFGTTTAALAGADDGDVKAFFQPGPGEMYAAPAVSPSARYHVYGSANRNTFDSRSGRAMHARHNYGYEPGQG